MAVISGTDTRYFCSLIIAWISSVFSEKAIRSFFSTVLLFTRRSSASSGAESSLPRLS